MKIDHGFWDKRTSSYGHTGHKDQIVYEYDQALRLKIVKELIIKLQGPIKNTKILDIGCGVGDFSIMFAKMGAYVTGIDISQKAIEKAMDKQFGGLSATFLVNSIQDMDFAPSYFHAVTSITVLQHISHDKVSFTVQKLVDVLKTGGYLYLLENAPIAFNQNMINNDYVYYRTRNEWVEIVAKAGGVFYFEMKYPNLGLSLIELFGKVGDKLAYVTRFRTNPKNKFVTKTTENATENRDLTNIKHLIKKIILFFSKPIDYYLPILPRFGATRIMVFKKEKVGK